MSATILNTDSNINAKTVMCAENTETLTGVKTFDLDPNPPFVVTSGSAVVPNLDADKVDGKHSTDLYLLNGTQTLTAGIPFPATQVASAGANVLDDYEEGTFTPTITSAGGGTPTYTTQTGMYVKIGQFVYATGRVQLSGKGTLGVGQISISLGVGFPFVSNASASAFPLTAGYYQNLSTSVSFLSGIVTAGAASIPMYYMAAGGGTSLAALLVADVSATFDVIFSVCFRASA